MPRTECYRKPVLVLGLSWTLDRLLVDKECGKPKEALKSETVFRAYLVASTNWCETLHSLYSPH